MAFRVIALALVGAVLLSACDQGTDYDSNRGDDAYDLEAMALQVSDLPADFEQAPGYSFGPEEWAEIFGSDDPEATVRQLEAQGWLKNWVTEATPPQFGAVLNIRSVSTLYTNEGSAKESTERFACGLPLSLNVQLDPFIVPDIADQSNGFFVEEEIDGSGTTLVYTTVCFRTGRIVHVVQQASLPGIEDIGAALRSADKMLKRVDAAFADQEDDGAG